MPEYKASHLLVKHRDVRNPTSWKEPQVTRSPEEALSMIQAFHAQLFVGDPQSLPQRFAELASKESHCSSAKRGGDLGTFKCALLPGCPRVKVDRDAAPACSGLAGPLP